MLYTLTVKACGVTYERTTAMTQELVYSGNP